MHKYVYRDRAKVNSVSLDKIPMKNSLNQHACIFSCLCTIATANIIFRLVLHVDMLGNIGVSHAIDILIQCIETCAFQGTRGSMSVSQ